MATARAPRRAFWLNHLRQWREQGGTLKAYAEANGLSVSALYAAKSSYEGASSRKMSKPVSGTTLLPVQISAPSRDGGEAIRVLLPNGVVIEVPSGLSAAEWAPLMMLLATSS